MIAAYIGRFQPFHLGHLAVLQEISLEEAEIIIVIGSAQVSHTPDNPFTAGERMAMIHASLGDLRHRCVLVPLQDVDRNAIWVSHLRSMAPPFDRVYTNNPLVTNLFQEAGVEVRGIPMCQRASYSGTVIRSLMLEGGNWQELVPLPVAEFVHSIRGVERLRDICGNDKE